MPGIALNPIMLATLFGAVRSRRARFTVYPARRKAEAGGDGLVFELRSDQSPERSRRQVGGARCWVRLALSMVSALLTNTGVSVCAQDVSCSIAKRKNPGPSLWTTAPIVNAVVRPSFLAQKSLRFRREVCLGGLGHCSWTYFNSPERYRDTGYLQVPSPGPDKGGAFQGH
jgi:hypothetical protein